jgi:AraC-like DNA-binding protein
MSTERLPAESPSTPIVPQRLAPTPVRQTGVRLPSALVRTDWVRPAATTTSRKAPAVVTVLRPEERTRVDAAGEGCYIAVHRDSVDDALQELRHGRAQGVLLSVARCDAGSVSSVAKMVREFPMVPAVALLSDPHPTATQAVLSLGLYGVRSLVDVRDANGWQALRQLFVQATASTIEREAVRQIRALLVDAPEDCRRFFEGCLLAPARVSTVRQLARRLGVGASTLMSRFYRAGLPAPKRYLAYARLLKAAALFENPGLSITQVSHALEFSSPQSFTRHVQSLLGLPALRFRHSYDGPRLLARLLDDLITPHLATLRHFRPLVSLPAWTREEVLASGVPPRALHRAPRRQTVPQRPS